jgi:hypothetical protein
LAYFTFARDWTPWVVSDDEFERLRAFMRPPEKGDRVLDTSRFESAGTKGRAPSVFERAMQWWKS